MPRGIGLKKSKNLPKIYLAVAKKPKPLVEVWGYLPVKQRWKRVKWSEAKGIWLMKNLFDDRVATKCHPSHWAPIDKTFDNGLSAKYPLGSNDSRHYEYL